MSQENEIEAEKLNPTTGFLPSGVASCSPSSTPRTDALEVPILETRANAIIAFQTVVEHAKKMERLYETECKDYASLLKTLKKVISERDALLCNCQTKYTTLWGGKNMDVPRCPECGKMRVQYPENAPAMAAADTKTPPKESTP